MVYIFKWYNPKGHLININTLPEDAINTKYPSDKDMVTIALAANQEKFTRCYVTSESVKDGSINYTFRDGSYLVGTCKCYPSSSKVLSLEMQFEAARSLHRSMYPIAKCIHGRHWVTKEEVDMVANNCGLTSVTMIGELIKIFEEKGIFTGKHIHKPVSGVGLTAYKVNSKNIMDFLG